MSRHPIFPAEQAVLPPQLEIDVSKYLPDLAELDITEEQKIELLQILWSIMRSCVYLGVDVGLLDSCGQVSEGFNEIATSDSGPIESSLSPKTAKASSKRERRRDG